jgi:hypothetical protein
MVASWGRLIDPRKTYLDLGDDLKAYSRRSTSPLAAGELLGNLGLLL